MTKSNSKLRDQQKDLIALGEEHGLISPLVHVGQFQSDCKLLLSEGDMDPNKKTPFTTKNLSSLMDVDEETIEELQQVCSPSSLYCSRESEVNNWDQPNQIPRDTGLVTLEHWKNNTKYKEDKSVNKCKYSELDCALREKADKIKAKDASDQLQYPDVVLTVCVNFSQNNRNHKNCGVDYLVLGSQKLSELRDRIPCGIDHQPVGNFTDNPDHPRDIKLKDVCPSSFFLIENTFFNDTRPPCIDISRDLIEWSKTIATRVPEDAQRLSMSDVTFNDLTLRLGFPYFFCHQGLCEHLIVFKGIRLLNESDCQSRSAYPVSISRAIFKTIPCKVCNYFISTWMTRNDSLAPEDPCFLCDSCFRQLHYDKQGTKVGDFIAFPYFSLIALDY